MSASQAAAGSTVPAAVHRLELSGELTIQTAGERKAVLVEGLAAAERGGATDIELDLGGVTELDTAGVQLLLLAAREAAQAGRELRLTGVSRSVGDVLAIAFLDTRLARPEASAPVAPATASDDTAANDEENSR